MRDDPWDPDRYDDDHGFVHEYGRALVGELDPGPDERVLDAGCGTGHLTRALADRGATVVGVDASPSMIAAAREAHPDLAFVHADLRTLDTTDLPEAVDDRPFDAVLSNAVLHWIPEGDQPRVLSRLAALLREGGRFVAELGGSGNVSRVFEAVRTVLADRGYEAVHPWYFPTVGEYATRLEAAGFEVRLVRLFDRPTELDGGEAGLAGWLRTFGEDVLDPVPAGEREAVFADVAAALRPDLYDPEADAWTVDYRRLRVRAVRE